MGRRQYKVQQYNAPALRAAQARSVHSLQAAQAPAASQFHSMQCDCTPQGRGQTQRSANPPVISFTRCTRSSSDVTITSSAGGDQRLAISAENELGVMLFWKGGLPCRRAQLEGGCSMAPSATCAGGTPARPPKCLQCQPTIHLPRHISSSPAPSFLRSST